VKKIVLMVGILIFCISFVYSQSITVTYPHGGLTWYKGERYLIKWSHAGSMNPKVKIRLYQGQTKILGIVDSTDNDGEYEWRIPENLLEGSYYIRVKTIDNQVYDDGEIFTISERVQPKLTMIFPLRGEKLKKDRTYKIRWRREGDMSSQVAIKLYKQVGHGLSFIMDIVSSYVNNVGENFYLWRIPSVLENGKYVIKINAVNERISAESRLFFIDDLLERIDTVNNPASNFLNLPDLYIQKASVYPVEGAVNKTKFEVRIGNMGLKSAVNVKAKLIINGPENYAKVIEYTFPNISKHGSVDWKAEFYFKKKGRYIFTYTVNESRGIREKRYDNNKVIKTILTKGLPDLIVCVDDKKEVAPGRKIVLNIDVKNIGDKSSCNRCFLDVYIWNIVHDPRMPAMDPFFFNLPSISPGGHRSFTITRRWFLPGVRKVVVYVVCPVNSDCTENCSGNNSVKTYIKVVETGAPVHNTGKKKCSD